MCQFERVSFVMRDLDLKPDPLFPASQYRSEKIMHFPERDRCPISKAQSRKWIDLFHISVSASTTFNSYETKGLFFVAPAPAYQCIPRVSKGLPLCFYHSEKSHVVFKAISSEQLCPFFREDITGSTALNTVPCYEEVTKVHGNRGSAVWEHGDLQQPVPPVAVCFPKAGDKWFQGVEFRTIHWPKLTALQAISGLFS